jgi:hypothetical protein
LVTPKRVQGVEIYHSVLTSGEPVLAAGEANIAGFGGTYWGLTINNHSGHYRPSVQSVEIGRQLFESWGITFE